MTGLLVVATLAAIAGLFTLTQATMGVGFIGIACLCAICARIVQAQQGQATVTAPSTSAPVPARPLISDRQMLLRAGLLIGVLAILGGVAFLFR